MCRDSCIFLELSVASDVVVVVFLFLKIHSHEVSIILHSPDFLPTAVVILFLSSLLDSLFLTILQVLKSYRAQLLAYSALYLHLLLVISSSLMASPVYLIKYYLYSDNTQF